MDLCTPILTDPLSPNNCHPQMRSIPNTNRETNLPAPDIAMDLDFDPPETQCPISNETHINHEDLTETATMLPTHCPPQTSCPLHTQTVPPSLHLNAQTAVPLLSTVTGAAAPKLRDNYSHHPDASANDAQVTHPNLTLNGASYSTICELDLNISTSIRTDNQEDSSETAIVSSTHCLLQTPHPFKIQSTTPQTTSAKDASAVNPVFTSTHKATFGASGNLPQPSPSSSLTPPLLKDIQGF